MRKRLLSIVLSCVMLLQLLPVGTLAAGTGNGQRIEVGQHVAMGKKDGRDLTWKILTIEDGKALLFSNYVLDFITLAKRGSPNFNYCYSELFDWCQNLYRTSFTEAERDAIYNLFFLNKTDCSKYVKEKPMFWPGLSGTYIGAQGLGTRPATENNCAIWLSSSLSGQWVDVLGWNEEEGLYFGTCPNLTMYTCVEGACPAITLELDKVEFVGKGTFDSPYTLRYGEGGIGDSTESGPAIIKSLHPSNGQENVDSANLVPYLYFDRDVSHQSGKSVDLDFSKAPFTVYQAEDNKVIYQAKEDAGLRGTSSDIKIKAAEHVVFFSGCSFEPGKTYYITMGEGFIKMADGTVSPEIKKGDWEFTTAAKQFETVQTITVGTGSGTGALPDVRWNDGWFWETSLRYNHNLAKSAMALAAAAYAGKDNMKSVYSVFEFPTEEKGSTFFAKYPSVTVADNDFVGYSFATKEIYNTETGESCPLVVISVRGTPKNEEWYSNFNIGTDGTHDGFYIAAYDLQVNLDQYISSMRSMGYDMDRAKFLVTGHSRGAAVANIIAAVLTVPANGYAEKENVFAYTFATPAVSTFAQKTGYDNIFNIINAEDFVTQVPLGEKKWGYKRYGNDLVLPSKSFYATDYFGDVYYKMSQEYLTITGGKHYVPYEGCQAVNGLTSYLYSVAPNTYAYYHKIFGSMTSVRMTLDGYFTKMADFLVDESAFNLVEFGVAGINELIPITAFFVINEKIDQRIFSTHSPASYLAWMRSCTADELFDYLNLESYSTYKQVKVACPVDVYVYNEAGTLVASVVNEEVVAGTLAVSVQDGVKTIDLPADQEYRVEIKAREAGTVDYTVEEKSVDSAIETTRTVFFDDITITKGDKLVGKITEEPSSQTYSLTKNNQTVITATSDSDAPSDLPFTDVTEKDWFYNDVKYAYENGLMNGVGEGLFGPSGTTTRGMIVTILYRLEGEPSAALSAFQDVASNQWYAKAVGWAAANGIVTGYSESQFGPNDKITREQMAAILYRYAAYKGYDVSQRADLSKYEDQGTISSYAVDSMAWANGEGLINGIDADTLNPKGSAIRAQVAAILHRFCENIA